MSLHLDMFAEISLRKIVTNIKDLELYEDIEANEALGRARKTEFGELEVH